MTRVPGFSTVTFCPSTMTISQSREKEMSVRLRALVDNLFEEGHYEEGLAELDKLRHPTYKPSMFVHCLATVSLLSDLQLSCAPADCHCDVSSAIFDKQR